MSVRSTPWILFVVLIAAACGSEGEEGAAEVSAAATAPSTPAEPEIGGSLHVNSRFIGMEDTDVELGTALAYVEGDSIRVDLVGSSVGAIECGHAFRLGHEIEDGQLVVSVDTHGFRHSVPFSGQAGTYEHVGYTYYYRRAGFDRGTNSGSSASEDADTELVIAAIDDSTVQGTVRIRQEVTGSFVARVCPE